MSNNDEKNNLKSILDFIEEFGADQDDLLEKLELELNNLKLLKSIFDSYIQQYDEVLINLEKDLFEEVITIKEFKFGKKIADSMCLKNKVFRSEIESKLLVYDGKIQTYKSIIKNLKSVYDSKKDRLNNILFFETQNIDGSTQTNLKLMKRPVGIHPGNPIAARKNKVYNLPEEKQNIQLLEESENYNNNLDVIETFDNEIFENEKSIENENLNNVLNQLNNLLDESHDKLKVVNKDLIYNSSNINSNEENKDSKKRGRKSNKS